MSRCFGIIAVSKVRSEEEGKERMWEGFEIGRGQGGDLYILFHWWDCVPLDVERSLVLSFAEPCLFMTVPLLLPPLPPPPPSTVRSFSPCSDPLSERREFWRDGVLGWRESWPFFSSEVNTSKRRNEMMLRCASLSLGCFTYQPVPAQKADRECSRVVPEWFPPLSWICDWGLIRKRGTWVSSHA